MSLPSRETSVHNGTVTVRGVRTRVAASPRRPAHERLPLLIAMPVVVAASLAMWAAIVLGIGRLVGWL